MALAPMMMLAQSKRVMAAARRNKQPLFNAGMGMLTFFLAGHGFKQQVSTCRAPAPVCGPLD